MNVTAITRRRPPHRHRWTPAHLGPVVCVGCQLLLTDYEARQRKGRQVRNYGNRAELAAANQYGGRKVGHAQGPTDIVGVTTKTQLKTRRGEAPAMWRSEFAKLDVERDGRLPRLLLRFVRPGNAGPDDYFVIRGRDYLEWFGKDE